MLRGNWLYVIAAGLGALCLSTASAGERVTYNGTVLDCVPEGCFVVRYVPAPRLKPERESDQSNASGADKPTAKSGEASPIIAPTPVVSETPADQPPTEQKPDYSYENLEANRWIRNWTGLAALATIVGVILIWRTLKEAETTTRVARLTLDNTRYGTNAARRTNTNTLFIGKKQVRAYLSVIDGRVTTSRHKRTEMTIQSCVFNTGNSPAYKACIMGTVLVVRQLDIGHELVHRFDIPEIGNVNEIGGRDRRMKKLRLEGEKIRKITHDLIFRGTQFVFVGQISYFDVFDEPDTHDFSLWGKFESVQPDADGVFTATLEPADPTGWQEMAQQQ